MICLISRNKHLEEVNWKEYQAEEESRERMKRIQVCCCFQVMHKILSVLYFYLFDCHPLLSMPSTLMIYLQEANKNKTVVWDDADERKCQENYRKKYSHH